MLLLSGTTGAGEDEAASGSSSSSLMLRGDMTGDEELGDEADESFFERAAALAAALPEGVRV